MTVIPEALVTGVRCYPAGAAGWREFEDACIRALTYLFVPPLQPPRVQTRTLSGLDIRDAVFANRNHMTGSWGQLFRDLPARMIPIEFKNYADIGKDEVDQLRNYMRPEMGRLGILCCNKTPSDSAYRRRNVIYSLNEKKLILFLEPDHLEEMVHIKLRGEDPADLLVDLVEEFYLQHE
jgi:hypothetical protein